MELVDIYDKDGNPTGVVKEKGAPLDDGEYIMAVGMWVVDKSGRIFLTKRSMEKSFAPGKWENTSGHVQAGESCMHAILRELREETGIAVTEEQVALLGSACSGHHLGRNYGVRLEVPLEEVKFQKGETCDAKWASFEEFVEMAGAGVLSPALLPHLQGYKRAFLAFVGHPDSTALDFS